MARQRYGSRSTVERAMAHGGRVSVNESYRKATNIQGAASRVG
jgi:hypothetical protein